GVLRGGSPSSGRGRSTAHRGAPAPAQSAARPSSGRPSPRRPPGSRALAGGDRPRALGELVVERDELRRVLADRRPVALDGGLVAAGDRAGERRGTALGPV